MLISTRIRYYRIRYYRIRYRVRYCMRYRMRYTRDVDVHRMLLVV
jgi:hypothetical protein